MAGVASSRLVDWSSERAAVAKRVEGASSGAGSCQAHWKFGKLGGKPSLQTGQASVGCGVWREAALAAWEGSKVGAGIVKVTSLDFRNGSKWGPKIRVFGHAL